VILGETVGAKEVGARQALVGLGGYEVGEMGTGNGGRVEEAVGVGDGGWERRVWPGEGREGGLSLREREMEGCDIKEGRVRSGSFEERMNRRDKISEGREYVTNLDGDPVAASADAERTSHLEVREKLGHQATVAQIVQPSFTTKPGD